MSKSARKYLTVEKRQRIAELAATHSPAELCRIFNLKPRWLREPSTRGRRHV